MYVGSDVSGWSNAFFDPYISTAVAVVGVTIDNATTFGM